MKTIILMLVTVLALSGFAATAQAARLWAPRWLRISGLSLRRLLSRTDLPRLWARLRLRLSRRARLWSGDGTGLRCGLWSRGRGRRLSGLRLSGLSYPCLRSPRLWLRTGLRAGLCRTLRLRLWRWLLNARQADFASTLKSRSTPIGIAPQCRSVAALPGHYVPGSRSAGRRQSPNAPV